MQFGHALGCILCEILLDNPALWLVQLTKWIFVMVSTILISTVKYILELGLIFPDMEEEETLIASPLVLPMGWKNRPPTFGTTTEFLWPTNTSGTTLIISHIP